MHKIIATTMHACTVKGKGCYDQFWSSQLRLVLLRAIGLVKACRNVLAQKLN